MTSQPIQNLFDAVYERQIRSIPFMNAIRTGRESKTRGKIDETPTVNAITAAMPKGETMKLCEIHRAAGLNQNTTRKCIERHPEMFENMGRGLWVRF